MKNNNNNNNNMTTLSDGSFDEREVRQWLQDAWSPESSSLWTEDNPARGQCSVTALVIQDQLGGEIQKTPTEDGTHFYNHINGQRYDLTAEQFEERPEYLDLASNREEAFDDTNAEQYAVLSERFCVVVEEKLTD